MAMNDKDTCGVNFADFEKRIEAVAPNENQRTMLNSRIKLLRSFFLKNPKPSNTQKGNKKGKGKQKDIDQADIDKYLNKHADKTIWDFKPGELTIVDLSCPFVEEGAACACLILGEPGNGDDHRGDRVGGEPFDIAGYARMSSVTGSPVQDEQDCARDHGQSQQLPAKGCRWLGSHQQDRDEHRDHEQHQSFSGSGS